MAGMFIIFESDDIFKWAAVLAVYFFTDSFYKKYLRVEANLADDMTGNDIYQFIGQHALSVDCYFGIISKKIRKYRIIIFAEYFLCDYILDVDGENVKRKQLSNSEMKKSIKNLLEESV